jgi:ribonuclease HI
MTCGAGAVALSDEGRIVGWEWQALPTLTNNEAEYAGLLLGIALARRLAAEETVFVLDSEIVVGQMAGRFEVHSATLRRWHWQACEAVRGLPAVRFCVVPREWNRLADGLACQAGIAWEWLKKEVDKETRRQGDMVTRWQEPALSLSKGDKWRLGKRTGNQMTRLIPDA